MKNRNPFVVFVLSIITFGIYSWYWYVKTKGEMNRLGEKIPTAWIWLIPIIGSFWWYWEYSKAVDHITHQELNWVITLLVTLLLGSIGQAIIQDYFNKINVNSVANPMPTNIPSTPPMTSPINNTPNLNQTFPNVESAAQTIDTASNLSSSVPSIETPDNSTPPDPTNGGSF